MRDVQYFNGAGTPYNPYISTPVNNLVQARTYESLVRSSIPASQVTFGKRKMMKWFVPERGIIEMYINPQSIKINEKKNIKADRTKGGFVIQYWGEELIDISINGTTGSSGIEGINILRQLYRAEQIAFDVVAIEEFAKMQTDDESFIATILPGVGDIMSFMKDLGASKENTFLAIPKPTLGYYAASVEMYWCGEIYRGFFDSFSVDENVSKLGFFDYSISFKATQRRGIRQNYLPWQHSATAGPSDHTSIPYTFAKGGVPTSNSDFVNKTTVEK